jgi:hypothetical protein
MTASFMSFILVLDLIIARINLLIRIFFSRAPVWLEASDVYVASGREVGIGKQQDLLFSSYFFFISFCFSLELDLFSDY